MRYKITHSLLALTMLCCMSVISSCADTQDTTSVEIHEIFNVNGDDASKKPTTLKYKEVKQFDNGELVQQNFYNVDNTLKGYEFIKRTGNKGVTNYYSADSTLLAIYDITYVGDNIHTRKGYDGLSKELLRSEMYEYDSGGNMTIKRILNEEGQLVSSFSISYDGDGNEIGFVRYDATGKPLTAENYTIVAKNSNNQWTERWGYVNEEPHTFHRRTFSK